MINSFIDLIGFESGTYDELGIGLLCGVCVLYAFTSLLNILQSFFKG